MLPNWQTSIRWMATDGTDVRQGDKVVELDSSAFTTDLENARESANQAAQELAEKSAEWSADTTQKQLDLERKRADYDKAKLYAAIPKEIIAGREYEENQLKLKRTKAEYEKAVDVLRSQKASVEADRRNLVLSLQKAERKMRTAEEALDSLILRAPRDGIVVIGQHPWEGRKLKTGDQVFVGLSLAMIPEIQSLQVVSSLADVDDRRIAVGMPATVTLDAYPDRRFSGKVREISAVAQESSRQSLRRAFRVVVVLDHVDTARMRPGLSAQVVVRRQTLNDALLASRAALDLSARQAKARVADSKLLDVTLGACNAQECVVIDGLKEGDELEAPHV